jgi:serine/threonine protein kinase
VAIQIGDILGDYQVTGILGRGGMGKVFRVRSLVTDREEAMKVVLPGLADDSDLADRFLRDIKVHASLQHPNIATLHTALRIEDRLIMILELVEGESLEEKLRAGAIDAATATGWTAQTLSALDFAHRHGVIHRDIKPANLLITPEGTVKLTDFGIARSNSAARLTGTGMAVGTLAYMSPEQIRSAPVDARSDIYSLGLTFYEMVTGRRAVEADTEHALMNAQLADTPPAPAVINPFVPPAISAVIMRAIAKAPERRFQTAAEFAAALQQFAHTPVQAGQPPPDLAELEARLSRAIGPIARRLVADAARRHGTVSEIRRALAAQIDDKAARDEFLKTAEVTATMYGQPGGTFDPAVLERFTHALAPFLGPIAKVLVGRAARQARGVEELRDVLAAEISGEDDRRRFLKSLSR